jgi:hypothetical protein
MSSKFSQTKLLKFRTSNGFSEISVEEKKDYNPGEVIVGEFEGETRIGIVMRKGVWSQGRKYVLSRCLVIGSIVEVVTPLLFMHCLHLLVTIYTS